MATSTSTFYLNVSAIKALCQGVSGAPGITQPGIRYGYVAPTISVGASGDFFFNIASLSSYQLYGPKTTTWPTSAITLTTAEYLTSYVTAAIDTELSDLTGGSDLALACLKDGGNSGYGILSSLRILNEGADQANRGSLRISTRAGILNQYPHITCSAFSDENFRVDWDGSLTAFNGNFDGVIRTHSDYESTSGTNKLLGGCIIGTSTNFVSGTKSSLSIGAGTSAIAAACFVGGSDTLGTGKYSVGLGALTKSIGDVSFAMGYNTRAVGGVSIALGTSAVSFHDGTFVWSGGSGLVLDTGTPPTADRYVGSSSPKQVVFYSSSGTHIGGKMSINNFETRSFTISDRFGGTETVTLTVPITANTSATLTVNGTISGNNAITYPRYNDSTGNQLLTSRQVAPDLLTGGASTADIILTINTLIKSLTAHGLIL